MNTLCNLNILVKSIKKNGRKYTSFLKNVTNNSYQSNSDGDGIYLSDPELLIRSLKKIKINRYVKEIEASEFIITHQRIATSGFGSEYTQPFESKEFVLAHNGVMNDFIKSGELHSDTYSFFYDFIDEFKKQKGKRQTKMIKAIKKLMDERRGSYSIVILDKAENTMYYFKNFTTSINFYTSKSEKILYITTKWDNEKYFKRIHKFEELDIKDHKIYKIYIKDEKVEVLEVDDIKEHKVVYEPPVRGSRFKPNSFDQGADFDYPERQFRTIDVFSGCVFCANSTDQVDPEGYPICRECQLKGLTDQDMDGIFNPQHTYTAEFLQKRIEKLDLKIETTGKIYEHFPKRKRKQRERICKLLKKKDRAEFMLEVILDNDSGWN